MAGGANFILDKGYKCTAAVAQFLAVKLSTFDTVAPIAGLTDAPLGICQETISTADATNGRVADIRLLGISRAIAGGSITLGDRVKVDATGKLITVPGVAGTNDRVVGIALETAVLNDQFDVLLTPGATNNTAVS
jgi:hypothetical protein